MSYRWRTIIIAALIFIAAIARAQTSFIDYSDIQRMLPYLPDALPAELKTADAWRMWVTAHDQEIRRRLVRGDEDTITNWLLFGTSFTQEQAVSRRIRDFVAALAAAGFDERAAFARELLLGQGYRFDTAQERTRLERHLLEEVQRVAAERRIYALRQDDFAPGDFIGQVMAESSLFRDRGLSLDTSILSSFAIEEALKAMRQEGLLAPQSVRRVAVIGPGFDFADKNSGYDFYPPQTLQPFTTIDSLVRLGLAGSPSSIDVTAFDISPRVIEHITRMRNRAQGGAPYILRLANEAAAGWTPELANYWKSAGRTIGAETAVAPAANIAKGVEVRTLEVEPEIAARIAPVNLNVVTQKWTGPPFDLVIATNVFVYYDKLDQSLAFTAVEAMLRPGGFFITNNAIVELPVSRLRSVGLMTVRHSQEKIDHVFWYRRR
jgi:hypothetical protein